MENNNHKPEDEKLDFRPVSPVILDTQGYGAPEEIVIGAGQPEFIPVPAIVCNDGGTLLMRLEVSDEALEKMRASKSVWVYITTFGNPMQPLMVSATAPQLIAPPSNEDDENPFADIKHL